MGSGEVLVTSGPIDLHPRTGSSRVPIGNRSECRSLSVVTGVMPYGAIQEIDHHCAFARHALSKESWKSPHAFC
jgi:hypothetical protein